MSELASVPHHAKLSRAGRPSTSASSPNSADAAKPSPNASPSHGVSLDAASTTNPLRKHQSVGSDTRPRPSAWFWNEIGHTLFPSKGCARNCRDSSFAKTFASTKSFALILPADSIARSSNRLCEYMNLESAVAFEDASSSRSLIAPVEPCIESERSGHTPFTRICAVTRPMPEPSVRKRSASARRLMRPAPTVERSPGSVSDAACHTKAP